MIKVHVEINRAACEGHGLCAQAAPEIYELDDDGYARLRVAEISESQHAGAEEGARACPVVALTIRQ
ncbi:MAG: ferredoxin [Mycobacterium sp.]